MNIVASSVLLAAASASAVEAPRPRFQAPVELAWQAVEAPAGGREAVLWTGPGGERGTMVSWKFNSKPPAAVAVRDTRFVILAGTFTLDMEGAEQRQFGPGAFVELPRGTKYQPGCEAAGECVFVRYEAADVAGR